MCICQWQPVIALLYNTHSLYPPFPHILSSPSLPQGQTAQFACVTSRPPPGTEITIDWLKDGSPLRNLKRISVEQVEVGSLLTIVATRITDEGEYACVARNRIGEEETIDFSLILSSSVQPHYSFHSPLPIICVCLNPSVMPRLQTGDYRVISWFLRSQESRSI